MHRERPSHARVSRTPRSTHGDNLKDGVRTDYGTVRIARHTELELCFNDPATGQLHPGVRETIRKGENLFVTYPGYSDYRHIPVIGKGVTLRLPHSPDSWGMMCEGDLEEVYRYRSIAFKLTRLYLTTSLAGWIVATAIEWLTDMGRGWGLLLSLGFTLLGAKLFHRVGARPMSQRLRETTRLVIAEGGGNLTQRLPRKTGNDETTFIGLWVNSFIDNLELIIRRVVRTSREIRQTNQAMLDNNQHSHSATTAMMTTMRACWTRSAIRLPRLIRPAAMPKRCARPCSRSAPPPPSNSPWCNCAPARSAARWKPQPRPSARWKPAPWKSAASSR